MDEEEKFNSLIPLNAILALVTIVLTIFVANAILPLSLCCISLPVCAFSYWKLTWKESRTLLRVFLMVNLICLFILIPKLI